MEMNTPSEEETRFSPEIRDENTHNSMNDVCVFLMNQKGICISLPNQLQSVTAQTIIDILIRELSESSEANGRICILSNSMNKFFALWMTSPYLELQLKPLHRPFNLLSKWSKMLNKYGPSDLQKNRELIENDSPILSFQRNVFLDKSDEQYLEADNIDILRLLYEEAKINVLDGRYPCKEYENLAAIHAAIETFDSKNPPHESYEYFRERSHAYLPIQHRKNDSNRLSGLFNSGQLNRSSINIFNYYKDILKDEPTKYKLLRSYMECVWALPFYGSAFFTGQIEKPAKGLASLLDHFDIPVWVAINREGIHVIEKKDAKLLLSLNYDDLHWQLGSPCDTSNSDCIPCLFVQFKINSKDTKILQVFSRQVYMMESLINSFVGEVEQDKLDSFEIVTAATSVRTVDSDEKLPSLSCKVNRLSLATVDNSGKLINKKGPRSLRKV